MAAAHGSSPLSMPSGQYESAEIRDIFPLGEFTVDHNIVHHGILGVLLDNAVRPAIEVFGVLFGPPVMQIAVGVELAAFIVESVRQFVPYGAAGIAVVGGIIHPGVKQGRLEHARGKVNSFICGS